MVRTFLQDQTQEWKDKYVRALVAVSVPWGGTVKSLKTFIVGTLKEIKYITQT